MVRSYPDMSVRVIQYAPYRITFCLYFRMEIDLVPFRFYVFLIEYLFITRVRDKDCVKNRVKRAKIVRFTLC